MRKKTEVRLSRKERERLRHRQEIMNAAERVFVKKGYHYATVEEIAMEAEFAVGTLYNMFKGKNDLFNELFGSLINEFMDGFYARVMTPQDPYRAIKELVRLRLESYAKHHGFFKVAFETLHKVRVDESLNIPADCVRLYEEYLESMSGKIQEGITGGIFIEEDPLYLVLMIDGITHSFMCYWMWQFPERSPEASIEQVSKIVLNSLTPGKEWVKEQQ